MSVFNWDGASNLDLKVLGQSFDFRSDVLQISDPSLQAHQFDMVENGTDLAIVKSRDTNGAPLAPADVTYAYIPNMLLRQIGVDASMASQNIVLSDGGQLWVGERDTDTVLDNEGNDVQLTESSASVQVLGLGGADTIATGVADDRVYGNTGADEIVGGGGDDSLYGGQDDDVVAGGSGNDNVAGDLGNDELDGGGGNDVLYGGAGNDVIETGTGNDTVFAGAGDDGLTLNNSATGDKLVYMDKGQDYVEIASTTGNHLVYLGDNNDVASLAYNAGDQQVFGDGGNDTLASQNFGSDTMDGGDDDDSLTIVDGSIGEKTIIGGDGKDFVTVLDNSGNAPDTLPDTQVTVSAGGGDDSIFYFRGLSITDANDGGTGDDLFFFQAKTELALRDLSLTNVETVYFSGDTDSVIFADGNDVGTANGLSGNDTLDASAETSSAYVLNGDEHNDSLIGGAGDDVIHGGQGADTMVGNEGADTFQFLEDPGDDGTNNYQDVLLGFTGGEDRLAFDGEAFGGISAIEGFKGGDGNGADAGDNLLIATGQSYAGIDEFGTEFLDGSAAATAKAGFYVFVNATSGDAEIWFDGDMTDVGDAILIASFDDLDRTDQFDEGPAGNNSGDFIIV